MKKLIKVTSKHIKNSKKKPGGFNNYTCPITLALKDAGYPSNLSVDGKKVTQQSTTN